MEVLRDNGREAASPPRGRRAQPIQVQDVRHLGVQDRVHFTTGLTRFWANLGGLLRLQAIVYERFYEPRRTPTNAWLALAKVGVEGSNPFARSKFPQPFQWFAG